MSDFVDGYFYGVDIWAALGQAENIEQAVKQHWPTNEVPAQVATRVSRLVELGNAFGEYADALIDELQTFGVRKP